MLIASSSCEASCPNGRTYILNPAEVSYGTSPFFVRTGDGGDQIQVFNTCQTPQSWVTVIPFVNGDLGISSDSLTATPAVTIGQDVVTCQTRGGSPCIAIVGCISSPGITTIGITAELISDSTLFSYASIPTTYTITGGSGAQGKTINILGFKGSDTIYFKDIGFIECRSIMSPYKDGNNITFSVAGTGNSATNFIVKIANGLQPFDLYVHSLDGCYIDSSYIPGSVNITNTAEIE